MSGASIAAEVSAALAEVASDVGSGAFFVTLKVCGGGPDNPWDTDISTATEYEVPAAVFEYPSTMIDGTLIQQGDRKIMMSATSAKPTVADRIAVGAVDYAIINVMETAPSGVALYYEVQARA